MSGQGRDNFQPVASSVYLDDTDLDFEVEDVQEGFENLSFLVEPLVVPTSLIYNGTLSNNEFIGYNNLLDGSNTPIIAPISGSFVGFTFSNKNEADFDLEFRVNSTTGTPFYTWSVTDTETAVFNFPTAESVTAGDKVYVKYIDQGTNVSDAAIVILFKA